MKDAPNHLSHHSFARFVAAELQLAIAEAQQLQPHLTSGDRGLSQRIVVGLSGGFDSAALVVALNAVAQELDVILHVCHVNHGLRGRESDEDEIFCQRLCEMLAIDFHVRRVDNTGSSSEASLRESRYQRLKEVAGEVGSSIIAVAHTQDDQAETILFRLFRGASVSGIIGMSRARALSDSFSLVRPMLNLTRRDCLEFLAIAGVTARQDSSNDDVKYARNFIRHEVIPLIESRFPGMRDRILQFRSIVAAEDRVLEDLAKEAYLSLDQHADGKVWKGQVLSNCSKAVKRRVLAMALEQREIEVTFERLEALMGIVENAVETGYSLDGEWEARVNSEGDLVWLNKAPVRSIAPARVKVPGTTLVPILSLALRIESFEDQLQAGAIAFPHQSKLEALVDLSSVHVKSIELRQRRPGDVIQPFGMSHPVRLKQYLHTHKSSKETHKLSGLLLADHNEVLWVPGVGLSEKLRVNGLPTHRLTWVELAADSNSYS